MITFNGPRTDLQDDGERTYTLGEKRYLVGVIIHEVGHIYFPMTVTRTSASGPGWTRA